MDRKLYVVEVSGERLAALFRTPESRLVMVFLVFVARHQVAEELQDMVRPQRYAAPSFLKTQDTLPVITCSTIALSSSTSLTKSRFGPDFIQYKGNCLSFSCDQHGSLLTSSHATRSLCRFESSASFRNHNSFLPGFVHFLLPSNLVALLGGALLLEPGVEVVSLVGAGHVKAVPVHVSVFSRPVRRCFRFVGIVSASYSHSASCLTHRVHRGLS